MPTKLYRKTDGQLSHEGKAYTVENGSVDVPDAAVSALIESHGFSLEPIDPDAPAKPSAAEILDTDISGFTTPQLLDFAKENFGIEFAPRTAKADVYEGVLEEIERRKKLAA